MIRYAVVLLLAGLTTTWAGDVKKVDLTVKGMHCEDCSGKVKSALQKVTDVKDVEVNLKKGMAQVSLDASSAVSAEVLAKAVADAGFTASYKDGKETKTLTAVKAMHEDKGCDDMAADNEDCKKEGKSGCCMDKGAKAKTMKK
jgi:copper chaperone CopZ